MKTALDMTIFADMLIFFDPFDSSFQGQVSFQFFELEIKIGSFAIIYENSYVFFRCNL